MKINFESLVGSDDNEIDNTQEFCSLDRNLLDAPNLQLPRKSFIKESNILKSIKHIKPVQSGKNTTLALKLKSLCLKRADSNGADSFKILNSNVFGYTPYDTGEVKSDFTTMFNSMKKTKSIISPKILIRHMSSSDSSNMRRKAAKKSEESPNIKVVKKDKAKKTEKGVLSKHQSQH